MKLTAGLMLPFALAAGGPARGHDRRARLVLGLCVGAALIAALSVVVFGSGAIHLFATVRESQREGDWESIPGAIGTRVGLPEVGRIVGYGLAGGFVVITVRLLVAVWREGAGWATLALLVCASSLLPWYVGWLLPFAALAHDRRLVRATLWMTALVQAVQLLGTIPHG